MTLNLYLRRGPSYLVGFMSSPSHNVTNPFYPFGDEKRGLLHLNPYGKWTKPKSTPRPVSFPKCCSCLVRIVVRSFQKLTSHPLCVHAYAGTRRNGKSSFIRDHLATWLVTTLTVSYYMRLNIAYQNLHSSDKPA